MYKSRCKNQGAKWPSTYFREHKVACKVRAHRRNAADNVITATHTAFRVQAEFSGQLSKKDGNADLIYYLSKEVAERNSGRS